MALMLGIDLGTSGVKTIAVNPEGKILSSYSVLYDLIQPRPGWSEQSAGDWWDAVVESIRGVLSDSAVDVAEVKALSLSGQMHGSVFLDKAGEVIRNPLLWNDTRTTAQCKWITDQLGEEALIGFVGNPALEGFTAPKLIWLRDNEPENYNRVHTLMLPKDYIVYKLTGRRSTEMSDAAGSLLLDVGNRSWSAEVAKALNIDMAILPEVLEATDVVDTISSEISQLTGLSTKVKVVAGGADNACGAVGNGIVKEGIALASIGTSGVVLAHTDSMQHDRGGRIHSFNHAVPHSWYLMGVMLSAGMSLSWLKNEIIRSNYEDLNTQAAKIAPGSEGVVFLPYLYGERTPHRNPTARGNFFGLSGFHTQGHIIRSVFEGVAFGLRDSLDLIKGLGVNPSEIRVTGGGAKSQLWRQILADVFQAQVITLEADEGPAFGAALLAGVGAGIYRDIDQAVDQTIRTNGFTDPDKQNMKRYDEVYGLFRSLYQALEPQYAKAFKLFNS